MNIGLFIRLCVTSALLALAACGGGGGGGGGTVAGGGIGGTGITTGAITQIGSVTVNGVKYEVSPSTQITLDDAGGKTQGDLRIGMVVTVNWSSSASATTANTIAFASNVVGPVQGACVPGGTLTVMGQPVVVDDQTNFEDGFVCDNNQSGKNVVVSGVADASGKIHATLIQFKSSSGGPVKVRGTATRVDNAAKTFKVKDLTVNFASAQLKDFPANGQLPEGSLVEAKGDQAPVNNVLSATEVKIETAAGGSASQEEVEGFITATGSGSFSVGSQKVTYNSQTTFENGTSANIAVNKEVRVTGSANNGVIAATKVTFKSQSNIQLEADVGARSPSDNTLTVFGSTVTLQVNSSTIFVDKTTSGTAFGLGDLQPGNHVLVDAVKSGNALVATKVERDKRQSDPSKSEIRSTVDQAPTAPNLSMLGVTVQTSNQTQFKDAAGQSIDQSTFFANVTASSTIVNAKGSFSSGQLIADEASIESN